jgi:hypothetical protein
MTTENMGELFEAGRYRPFTIHLADGRILSFPTRGLLAAAPNGRTITVFEPGDGLEVIELDLVTKVELDHVRTTGSTT